MGNSCRERKNCMEFMVEKEFHGIHGTEMKYCMELMTELKCCMESMADINYRMEFMVELKYCVQFMAQSIVCNLWLRNEVQG